MERGSKVVCDKPIHISLTGDKSHKVTIPAGQGSFSIGTLGISEGKYDVWVNNGLPILWNAFDEFFTPAGGHWPRFFYYSGNDKGFIGWSAKRPIEDFHWSPKENASIDLTKANINRFFLHTEDNVIEVSTGKKIRFLSLSGTLKNIDVKKCATVPYLSFLPLCSKAETKTYRLPVYKTLEKAESVDISVSPVGQAFDCSSLLQFPHITSLNLSGCMTNLEALAKFKHLENIGLRFLPDVTNIPKLTTWNNLKRFIGWNIEETAGKLLRAELRELLKEKELDDYSSVSKLRKKIWFTTEYGIPFYDWNDKNAKIATKAYKACLKEINKAKAESEVYKAIIEFIGVINKLPDIETTEREDAGIAVSQLVESSALGISQGTGLQWFDEVRNF